MKLKNSIYKKMKMYSFKNIPDHQLRQISKIAKNVDDAFYACLFLENRNKYNDIPKIKYNINKIRDILLNGDIKKEYKKYDSTIHKFKEKINNKTKEKKIISDINVIEKEG